MNATKQNKNKAKQSKLYLETEQGLGRNRSECKAVWQFSGL